MAFRSPPPRVCVSVCAERKDSLVLRFICWLYGCIERAAAENEERRCRPCWCCIASKLFPFLFLFLFRVRVRPSSDAEPSRRGPARHAVRDRPPAGWSRPAPEPCRRSPPTGFRGRVAVPRVPIQPVAQAGQPGLEGVYPKGGKTKQKHTQSKDLELESEIVKGFFFFFFK